MQSMIINYLPKSQADDTNDHCEYGDDLGKHIHIHISDVHCHCGRYEARQWTE